MQSRIDLYYNADGSFDYIERTPLFQGQRGSAEFYLYADSLLLTDAVLIAFVRPDGEEANFEMRLLSDNSGWRRVSNGWETELAGALKVNIIARRLSQLSGEEITTVTTEQITLTVQPATGFRPGDIPTADDEQLVRMAEVEATANEAKVLAQDVVDRADAGKFNPFAYLFSSSIQLNSPPSYNTQLTLGYKDSTNREPIVGDAFLMPCRTANNDWYVVNFKVIEVVDDMWMRVQIVNFTTNLKGEKGDTGATGPQGPVGPQGDTGPAGAPMLPRRFYPSIDAMNADIDNVELNDLAIIQSPEGAADEDNAKMYMAVIIDGVKQWVFVSDLSGAKGEDGTISAAGMCPVAVTQAMWTGDRPYTVIIPYNANKPPLTHDIGETRFLMVGFLPDASGDSGYGANCDYMVDDNGTITVYSNEKWAGTITVAGGSSETVKGISGVLTLPVSDWANNGITFTVNEMGEYDAVIISPYTTADKTNMELLELFPSAEGNQVTLTATSMPIVDITINYFILRGTENE